MSDQRAKACVKPLDRFETELMSKEQTSLLMGFSLAEEGKLNTVIAELDAGRDFLWQVFSKRAKSIGLNLEDQLRLFVVHALLSNPAESTQYLHAIYHHHMRGFDNKSDAARAARLEERYTLTDLCYLFPEGFPTERSRRAAWDAQKCDTLVFGSDNLLDTSAFFVKWSE